MGSSVGCGVVVVATNGGWYEVGRGVADGWTTGGADVVGAAGPLPE